MKNETKREKFERLAEQRVTEIIKKIRLVGNLANRRNYDYEKKHIEEIITTLEKELKDLKNKFQEENRDNQRVFSFSRGNKQ